MFQCKNQFQNYIKIVGQSYFDFHKKEGICHKLQDKHEVKLEII